MKQMKTFSLINGYIPANNPCPFLSNCRFRVHQCPTDTNIKSVNYSCAAAKIHAKLVELDDSPVAQEVRDIVEKRVLE